MRGRTSAIGALALALALVACGGGAETPPTATGATGGGGSPSAPATAERYENAEHRFAFDRPDGWELADPPAGAVVALYPPGGALDAFAENVNVVIEQLPMDLTATEYMDLAWAQLEPQLRDVEPIARDELTVGGMPAASIEYRARFPETETEMHLLQVAVLDGRTAFVITYTGTDEFERYRPDAEAIIASFART
ncbi:hypothetical protein HRbin12_00581 [bacterium HR12]|nr:hypothetical protein HRbin12_00581 [bacterium HR12]